jgi:hypothetical protein
MFNRAGRFMVMGRMFAAVHKNEILGAVIPPIPILMMDDFTLLRNDTVEPPVYQMVFVTIATTIFLSGVVIRRNHKLIWSVSHTSL